MRFERRDFSDWWHSSRLPERFPYLLILGLVLGAGLVALPLADDRPEPAVGSPAAPPGGIFQQATPMPVPLPSFEGEMTVIEPVQTDEPQMDLRAYERAIFTEVNKRRVDAGLQALVWDDRIADVARKHSEDMAVRGYFGHIDSAGRNSHDRFGTTTAAENIKGSWLDVTKDVNDWMASPGHLSNILHPQMRRTGVGMALGPEWPIITQNFLP